MRTAVLMPQLGLTMTQGTVMEWLKKPGEKITKGEILFTVENDKAVVEVEAQADGVLAEVLVPEGGNQEVGKPVAYIEGIQEDNSDYSRDRTSVDVKSFIPASPLARKIASDKDLNLASIQGTGPEGAVLEQDVLGFLSTRGEPRPVPEEEAASLRESLSSLKGTIQKLSPIRSTAAERMVQSWTTIPQFTLWMEVEADNLFEFHQQLKEEGTPVSLTVILAKLLAVTLEKFPLLNASYREGGNVEVFPAVNLGIAMDTPDGLIVPVLKDCNKKTVLILAEEWKGMMEKVRQKKVLGDDMKDGTFTLSNLGMFGVQRFQAIINPPQAAILSVGNAIRRPKEEKERIVFVTTVELGISADHRVVDGAYAARFLQALKHAVESPQITLACRG
jgi:pyruvate dehydrogenase E2 component (dihydrolipoamide acetyltransferase)